MSKPSVKVSSRLRNKSALNLLIRGAAEGVGEHIKHYAQTVVEIAASSTPRYSGEATLAWRVTTNKDTANSKKSYSDGWSNGVVPPKYDGIADPQAHELVDKVKNYTNLEVYWITEEILKSGRVHVYLYNLKPYADRWLQKDPDIYYHLRAVNHDFWTMEQIKSTARARISWHNRTY